MSSDGSSFLERRFDQGMVRFEKIGKLHASAASKSR